MISIVGVPLPARVVLAWTMVLVFGRRTGSWSGPSARYGSPPPLRPCILSVYHALTLPWRCNTWHDEQIDDLEQRLEDLVVNNAVAPRGVDVIETIGSAYWCLGALWRGDDAPSTLFN